MAGTCAGPCPQFSRLGKCHATMNSALHSPIGGISAATASAAVGVSVFAVRGSSFPSAEKSSQKSSSASFHP